jgi:hypothetical protein
MRFVGLLAVAVSPAVPQLTKATMFVVDAGPACQGG